MIRMCGVDGYWERTLCYSSYCVTQHAVGHCVVSCYPSMQAGRSRSADGLTFLEVFNAGHMVPMDQPKNVSFVCEACKSKLMQG